MATQSQIEETYDYQDEIFRQSLGEHADITCATFNGDFSKTLEQAQKDKHRYILQGVKFHKGQTVLDIGCGWGPMLNAVTKAGGYAIGLTLSPKQAEACRRRGFDVYLQDWKTARVEEFGTIDAIICVGAFEHFCSPQEYLAGQQDDIYRRFFKQVEKAEFDEPTSERRHRYLSQNINHRGHRALNIVN